MKLNEAEMRMAYQIEATSQSAALNEIYMTWRYAPNRETKDTAESLLKKLRPLSDKECMDVIWEVQANYRLPGKGADRWGNAGGGQAAVRGHRSWPGMTLWPWSGSPRIPAT